MLRYSSLLLCLLPLTFFFLSSQATAAKKPAPKPTGWTSLMDTTHWKLAKGYNWCKPWSVSDNSLEGSDSWIINDNVLGDFVLEGEFMYTGSSEGGIVLRGSSEEWNTWLSGYEMDIDASGIPGQGHVHFPSRPQPYPGEARFTVGQWQQFSIKAIGSLFTVSLGGKLAIRFTDDQFKYGQICLEGSPGGVRYRNLKVKSLEPKPPTGPRTPWTNLFDGQGITGWTTAGSVEVNNGTIEIDGNKGHSEVTFQGPPLLDGLVEVDVWCHRTEGSKAPYRMSLRKQSGRSGACFVFRPALILSCGSSCTSTFSGFIQSSGPEFYRFEMRGPAVDVFKYGETVMRCTDSSAAPGTICLSADSCALWVRGVRWRPLGQAAGGVQKRGGK